MFNKMKPPLEEVTRLFGTVTDIANKLDIGIEIVSNWFRRESIPLWASIKLSKMSEGKLTVQQLRPNDPEPFLSLFSIYGTSTEFANKLQISRQTVSAWVSRRKIPNKYIEIIHHLTDKKLSIEFLKGNKNAKV